MNGNPFLLGGLFLFYLIPALLFFVLWVIVPFAVFRIRKEAIEQTKILQQMAARLAGKDAPFE